MTSLWKFRRLSRSYDRSATPGRCEVELEARSQKLSLLRIRRHLLHHGEHQFTVAVVEVGGVAADLAEKADFVIGKLGQSFGAVAVAGFGEELRECDLHGARNF